MACRNFGTALDAKSRILARFPNADVECMPLDLSSLRSVREFAAAYAASYQKVDLLINNAGIVLPTYTLSEDGFESQLATNYLGHFALTGLLLPLIGKAPNARIISLSSLAHKWGTIQFDDINFAQGYSMRKAYGQSKLACLMFAYELQRRLDRTGNSTLSVAAHPGISATHIFNHLPGVAKYFTPLMALAFQPAKDGALPILYAALGGDIRGGDFCGPESLSGTRGAPVKVDLNRRSKDATAAAKLWSLSEELTGVRFLSEASAG